LQHVNGRSSGDDPPSRGLDIPVQKDYERDRQMQQRQRPDSLLVAIGAGFFAIAALRFRKTLLSAQ
jgi:hypothetical protein